MSENESRQHRIRWLIEHTTMTEDQAALAVDMHDDRTEGDVGPRDRRLTPEEREQLGLGHSMLDDIMSQPPPAKTAVGRRGGD
jgi:hypothetical protein